VPEKPVSKAGYRIRMLFSLLKSVGVFHVRNGTKFLGADACPFGKQALVERKRAEMPCFLPSSSDQAAMIKNSSFDFHGHILRGKCGELSSDSLGRYHIILGLRGYTTVK